MKNQFSFPNDEAGRTLRTEVSAIWRENGYQVNEFEEHIQVGEQTITLLILEYGARLGEGQIAADVKKRKQ